MAAGRELQSFRATGWRWGQLMALAGLTGLAVSQPLLNIAGENPSLFTFAGVSGWRLAAFALGVALGPPLVIWAVVVAVGKVQDRSGDAVLVVAAAALSALAALQWVKAAGIERRWAVALVAVAVAVAITVALMRWALVATFVRYSAVLPVISLLLLVLSPTGDLITGRTQTAVAAQSKQDLAPVVFIMLDEFPTMSLLDNEDQVDPVRFPNLAAFTDDATWYRNYTSQSSKTRQAVPSILSGRKPTEGSSALWTEHPDNLFSMLAPTHDLEVSEAVTQLCGFSTCELSGAETERGGLRDVTREMADVWRQRVSLDPTAGPDMDQFAEEAVPLPAGTRRQRTHEEKAEGGGLDPAGVSGRPERVNDFLGSLARPSARPSLHYLHLMLPHTPWVLYPDGTRYTGADEFTDGPLPSGEADDWRLAVKEQEHLLQAEYTDRLVGQILDTLHATGRYDRSLVVITADHGFSLKNRPRIRVPTPETIPGVAYAPLFIKAPEQTDGRVDDTNLMGPDVLPTVADMLGVQPTGPVDGLAATDPRITRRGDRKEIIDFDVSQPDRFVGIVEFDATSRPQAADRWVGPTAAGGPVLGGLFTWLGVEEYLGVDPASLDTTLGGTAKIAALDAVSTPGQDPALGELRGRIDGSPPPSSGTVLVGIGDRIASAAPISDDGSFRTLLPSSGPDGGRGALTLIHVDDNQLTQLKVEPLEP